MGGAADSCRPAGRADRVELKNGGSSRDHSRTRVSAWLKPWPGTKFRPRNASSDLEAGGECGWTVIVPDAGAGKCVRSSVYGRNWRGWFRAQLERTGEVRSDARR